MGADPIIYCLEQVTDYDQFERLCHELMALEGYSGIEPLGGSKDKGRDAIHVSRGDEDDVTIFAYSVREDWRRKLGQDAENIRRNGHTCRRLVFLSTGDFTPTERDSAVAEISREFGWEVELYGLERLRVLLSATHPEVVAKHPHIFAPPFFSQAGGLSLAECRDCVVIDHAEGDQERQIYTELWNRLVDFRIAAHNLVDWLQNRVHQDAHGKFIDTFNAYQAVVRRNEPFIVPAVFESARAIVSHGRRIAAATQDLGELEKQRDECQDWAADQQIAEKMIKVDEGQQEAVKEIDRLFDEVKNAIQNRTMPKPPDGPSN